MRQMCELLTSSYCFKLYLDKPENSSTHAAMVVGFFANPGYNLPILKSRANYILVRDLEELALYIEEHIAAVSLSYESHTFLPMCCSFQIQALTGEIDSNGQGDFYIRCSVNIVDSLDLTSSMYLGGESNITIDNARKFIQSLREFIEVSP
jgi:hypothetical protein